MKKILFLLPVFLIMFQASVQAESVTVNNYVWIHSNTIGDNQKLTNKTGGTAVIGDAIQNDAYIINLQFEYEGLTGERLYLLYPDGATQTVNSTAVTLNQRTKSVQIVLKKTTLRETWVALRTMTTDDASNGGTSVTYSYTINTPTRYGDLGTGTDNGGGTVDPDPDPDPTDPEPTNPNPVDTDPIFPVNWNTGTRRIVWDHVPTGTYEVVVTYPDNSKVRLTPSTKVLRVPDSVSGQVKVQAVKMDGSVIVSKMITVPEVTTDPNPTDPNPTDPNPTDPNPTDPGDDDDDTSGCLCPDLCEMLPIMFGGISADIQGLKLALHEDLQGLNDVLNQINNNTVPLHQDLGNINRVLDVVQANTAPIHGDLVYISDLLEETLRQITPVRDYSLPTAITTPNLYKPDDVMSAPYENTKTYFSDQGDAPVPDAMPAAPEPEKWVDDNGNEMNQDQEIVKQPAMILEPELQKSEEMKKEPEMKVDQELIQDVPLTSDTPLEVQQETYRLRWKSSEFP